MKDIKVGVYLLTANPLVRKGRIATYLHATVQPTAPKPTPNTESDDIAGTRGETYWPAAGPERSFCLHRTARGQNNGQANEASLALGNLLLVVPIIEVSLMSLSPP